MFRSHYVMREVLSVNYSLRIFYLHLLDTPEEVIGVSKAGTIKYLVNFKTISKGCTTSHHLWLT